MKEAGEGSPLRSAGSPLCSPASGSPGSPQASPEAVASLVVATRSVLAACYSTVAARLLHPIKEDAALSLLCCRANDLGGDDSTPLSSFRGSPPRQYASSEDEFSSAVLVRSSLARLSTKGKASAEMRLMRLSSSSVASRRHTSQRGQLGVLDTNVEALVPSKPVFLVAQILVSFGLWAVLSLKEGSDRAGLDTITGLRWRTDLRVNEECSNVSHEAWRWISYQFTHVSCGHVALNCVVLLLSIPTEQLQGSVRTCLLFNAGVIGGAMSYFVYDIHAAVVGMSGGSCALLGVQVAEVAMNWGTGLPKRCRALDWLRLCFGGACVLCEALLLVHRKESIAVHVGGLLGGVLVAVAIGRVVEKRWTRPVQAMALVVALGLGVSSVCWVQQWPPKNLVEKDGWCWVRQISSPTFGDSGWHCVWCADDSCISSWSSEPRLIAAPRSCLRGRNRLGQ